MSEFARTIFDPFNIFLFFSLISLLLWLLDKSKLFKWFIAVTAIWFYLITTPFLPYVVLNSLEKLYDPVDVSLLEDLDAEYHVVVLGAGYYYNERLPANSQLNLITLGRLVEGVRICNSLENCTLVTSGPYFSEIVSQAEVARKAAIMMGIPEQKILTQSEPRTTREEAIIYSRNHYNGQKVIVVTTAAHMHRAIKDFRYAGIDAIASPTNFRYKRDKGFKFKLVPSPVYIGHLRSGVFEYAALFRDRFRGGVN